MSIRKWIISLLNVAIVIIVLWNGELIIEWIKVEDKGSLLAVFPAAVVLAAVPGIPFGVVSGVIGAKYGAWLGSLISVLASTLGAVLVYSLFRYLLKRQGSALLDRHSSLRRMDQLIRKHTFWSILIARIIPIMPAALINIYAGVFGLRLKLFLFATLLGKIPVMAAFTVFGDSIKSGTTKWIAVLLIYILFLLIAFGVYRLYWLMTSKQ